MFQEQPYGPYQSGYRFPPKASLENQIEQAKEPTYLTKEVIEFDEGSDVEIEEVEFESDTIRTFKSATVLTEKEMYELTLWAGCSHPFGTYRGHKELANGVRLLSHSKGFAVFFPREVFYPYDIQVPILLSDNDINSCFIAGAGFGYIKVDVDIKHVNTADEKRYVDPNVEVALNRIEKFVHDNFVKKSGLYPESEYFSIGSYITHPDDVRPSRIKRGGDYQLDLKADNSPYAFSNAAVSSNPVTFFRQADVIDGKFIKIGGKLVPFSVLASSDDLSPDSNAVNP